LAVSHVGRHDPAAAKLNSPRRLPNKRLHLPKTAGTVIEGRSVDWRLFGEPRTLGPPYGGRYSYVMRPLRYSINVTLDGCCDHRAMFADEDLHRHAVENLNRADALLFGRVTYEMMEAAFRSPARTGARPDWMEPFARTIDAAKKYVVSSTLNRVDWNAELVRGIWGRPFSSSSRSRVRDCSWEA
jgi:hypothetical protein